MNTRIKELRKSMNMTQADFASKLGLTPSAISKIESGERIPAENTLKLICATYKVHYLWLTEGKGPMYRELLDEERLAAFVDQYAPNATPYFKAELIAAAKYLTDEEWKLYRDFVDELRRRADTEKAAP